MPASLPSGTSELAQVMWESPTVAVVTLDDDGVITSASACFHQLAAGDPIGEVMASYVPEGHRAFFDAALTRRSGARDPACISMFPDSHGNLLDVTLTFVKATHMEVLVEPHVANPMGKLAEVVTLNELLAETQRELSAKNDELLASVDEIKRSHLYIRKLEGILPICMNCRSVRDDSDDWTSLDAYLVEREAVSLSHSLCPGCAEKFLQEESAS